MKPAPGFSFRPGKPDNGEVRLGGGRVAEIWDLSLVNLQLDPGTDPVLGVHRHYGTDQIRQGTHFVNSSRYSNPRLDTLLAEGAREADAAKRSAMYKEIQEILANDMPVVNLFEMKFLTVFNSKLRGHDLSGFGAYGSFDRVWFDE